ncbi:chemotaxis protein CheD [Celerinatantimonas diazotrophica]|uniref:Probable chemoreceptor glutamine deamidase CheD n=1 Tax=Celerinatantimonas diazotrophica TaxID=412034 RepID=A0A4R1K361_9GAMM|nr:chemotaxis protein CheD [Celerinatantimonas diazotrophica]TCK58133.1 chemotaxis protein CheD [Celerinatantimonas diazotrophica]CAG9297795.1 Chemoreceptor glutamine deamidase CheD [Celerinatantimonas diazotrophica]
MTNRSTVRGFPQDHLIYLYAGDILFGRGYREVRTLLGSCVSIVLWHPKAKFCGVCHFAVPESPNGLHGTLNARYGNHCIELFSRFAKERGTELRHYQARIYGGGNMLAHHQPLRTLAKPPARIERGSVGEQNAGAAFAMLMQHKVNIIEADVGEQCYRKVYIDTRSGKVKSVCCYVG